MNVAITRSAERLPRIASRYTVRVGQLGIEVGDDFDAGTLRRLVAALAC